MSEPGTTDKNAEATTVTTTNAYTFLADEEARHDHQVTDALLLTYNTDLGFFEARLLGLLRATGARVTVIGDARVWSPDTRAVQHAGRSYHFGLCETAAAFHPKVLVLVGHTRAIAAVGSGNLTMGGWQYNSELLTVFTGGREGMPTAFADVRSLLNSLAQTCTLDPIATPALHRVVAALTHLLDNAPAIETGHHVHASWDGPLIDCLPPGPVEQVNLLAAFHDPASAAVAQVLQRLQPRHVQVSVQPGWTHLDPGALHSVLCGYAERSGATWDLLRDPASAGEPTERYRHGKLIEWRTDDGEWHALTGSPNLSQRALLTDVTSGGNYEVAVVGPLTQSLFPGGRPATPADIPTLIVDSAHDADASATTTAQIRVVAAYRTEDGQQIQVHLNGSTQQEVHIEVSGYFDSPDNWALLGTIAAGQQTSTLPTAAPAGSRIRAVTGDPDTGDRQTTAPVYVTDLNRIHHRAIPDKHTSRTHRAVAADLFGDDIALLDSLQGDLAAFARDLKHARPPTVSRDTDSIGLDPAGHVRPDDVAEPWLWLQESTVRDYGRGLASWLLALPRLSMGDSDATEVPWRDRINDDTEPGLENEDPVAITDEVLDAEPGPAAEVIDHQADRDSLKAARRRWATKAGALVEDLPLLSRLLILRITLAFWTAGNWSDNDISPFILTRNLLRAIRPSGEFGEVTTAEEPDELRVRIGVIAAVGLTVMAQRADLRYHNEQTLCYEDCVELAAPRLAIFATHTVDDETLNAYTLGLRTANEGALTAEHVQDTIAGLTTCDPFASLYALMAERGYDTSRVAPNQVHIHGDFSNPEQVALDAMGVVEEQNEIAVWASNPSGDWTLVAWQRPDMVTVNHREAKKGDRWRHQRLQQLMGPAAVAAALRAGGPGDLPNIVLPKHVSTTAACAVLSAVGIDAPEPPRNP